MKRLVLTIDIGNAATVDDHGNPDPYLLAGIVRDASRYLDLGRTEGPLYDYNGNRVGAVTIEDN